MNQWPTWLKKWLEVNRRGTFLAQPTALIKCPISPLDEDCPTHFCGFQCIISLVGAPAAPTNS